MASEITLKQLSQLSGYSISTVSKSLNDGYDISKKTKLKIRELARANNYIPNNTALALKNRKTNTIAVIVPKIDCEFCGSLLSEIQKVAFMKGYHILILQSLICKTTLQDCLSKIRGIVDGIIIVNTNNQKDNLFSNIMGLSKISFAPIITQNIDKISLTELKIIGKKIVTVLVDKIDNSKNP